MKSLTEYTSKPYSELWDKHQCFFAFSSKQMEEGLRERMLSKTEITVISNLNLICPKIHVTHVLDKMETIHQEALVKQLKDFSIEEIIKHELYNHEAFYTGEIEDTFSALSEYNVSKEQVLKVFINEQPNVEY